MICPLLASCKAKISMEHYMTVCSNVAKDAFRDCPEYKKLTAEMKTPLEWSRVTSMTA
jgi:hypothetical protein